METLKIYAVLDKNSNTISNVFLSSDNAAAGAFMIRNLKAIAEDVPAQLKGDFLDRVHSTCIVKIGECDCLNKTLSNDYNVICDLFDFSLDEVKEDDKGSSEV